MSNIDVLYASEPQSATFAEKPNLFIASQHSQSDDDDHNIIVAVVRRCVLQICNILAAMCVLTLVPHWDVQSLSKHHPSQTISTKTTRLQNQINEFYLSNPPRSLEMRTHILDCLARRHSGTNVRFQSFVREPTIKGFHHIQVQNNTFAIPFDDVSHDCWIAL